MEIVSARYCHFSTTYTDALADVNQHRKSTPKIVRKFKMIYWLDLRIEKIDENLIEIHSFDCMQLILFRLNSILKHLLMIIVCGICVIRRSPHNNGDRFMFHRAIRRVICCPFHADHVLLTSSPECCFCLFVFFLHIDCVRRTHTNVGAENTIWHNTVVFKTHELNNRHSVFSAKCMRYDRPSNKTNLCVAKKEIWLLVGDIKQGK